MRTIRKRYLDRLGPGGVACPCCSPGFHHKAAHNRATRKMVNRDLDKFESVANGEEPAYTMISINKEDL